MNRAFLLLHRWVAVVTGLVVVLVAGSGALAVFEGPIARAHFVHVAVTGLPQSLDSLALRAAAVVPGGAVRSIAFGDEADQAYEMQVAGPGSGRRVVLDQYTGEILPGAGPSRLESLVRRVHVFHTTLLAGDAGQTLVGLVALSSFLLVVTGMILWWRERRWRIRWSASWKRIVFDLHHALGVFAAVVLLVITLTGAWIGNENRIDPLVLRLNRTPLPESGVTQPPRAPGSGPVSLDTIVEVARRTVPGAPIIGIQLPGDAPVRVQMRYPEDHTPGGRSSVYIDRFRGTVLRSGSSRMAETGTRILNARRPLHTGDIYGAPTQVIWFLASLVLASQAVTGILMWWNGRAARRVAAA